MSDPVDEPHDARGPEAQDESQGADSVPAGALGEFSHPKSETQSLEVFAKWQEDLARSLAPSLEVFAKWQEDLARSLAPSLEAIARNQANLARTLAPSLEAIARMEKDIARTLGPPLEDFVKREVELARMIAPSLDVFAKWQKHVAGTLAPSLEAIASWQKDLARILATTLVPASERFREYWLRAMPSNWRDLPPSKVEAVVELMGASGLGLAWVPRVLIVEQLLTAEDNDARTAILVSRETEILLDIEEALGEVHAGHLTNVKEAAFASLRAYHDGHFAAAQALSAAALTEVVEECLGRSLTRLRKEYEAIEPMESSGPLQALRLLALLVGVARSVLARFERDSRIPESFNRHASLHTVSPTQYTHPNALSALLLLASLLRELQEASDEGGSPSGDE